MLKQIVAAFEDFLASFKTSASATEASATSALESLNINEDDLSDDYDFMDDAEDMRSNRQRNGHIRTKESRKKYMDILQQIADRQLSEICVELDDLDTVSFLYPIQL